MAARLDHTIVRVNDLDESVAFWTEYLCLTDAGREGPFAVLRVDEACQVQLAPWGTEGHDHYAFALDAADFDRVFARLREAGVPYGDRFDAADNMQGPGQETGARGPGRTLYFFDPNRHLLEIRSYDSHQAG